MSVGPVLTRYFAWDSETAVALAMRGDRQAWQALLNRHYAHIYQYAAAYCGPMAAEQVAARVFEQAVQHIGRYRGDRLFIAWLYEIAGDVVAHEQRPERRSGGMLRRLLPGRSRVDARAVSEAGATDTPEDLARAIATLPGAQRELMTLRYLGRLSTDEIAAITGRTPSSVYALEARALAALRTKLADEVANPPGGHADDASAASVQ